MQLKKYIHLLLLVIINLITSSSIAQNCTLDALIKDFDAGTPQFKKFINENDNALDIYDDLYKNGSKYVLTNPDYLKILDGLTPEVRKYIVAFTDDKAGSTLTKFLDDCNANPTFRKTVNDNPILSEAFVGYKKGWQQIDYEAIGEEIGELTSDVASVKKIEDWVNRSSKLANFGEVVRLGNSLNGKIVNSLKTDKTSKIFKALSEETRIPLDQLKNYDVLTEIPLETTGGFMKADVVLIKRNALKKIEDVIIIENKLSQNTAFTVRQKEGFRAIINGQKEMNIKYNLPKQNLTFADGPLKISKDKIFKIADGGTDNISNVTINKITKVN